MKRYIGTTLAALVLVSMSACGGSDKEAAAPEESAAPSDEPTAAPSEPAAGEEEAKEAALKTAAQGYVDALTSGDGMGARSYLHPKLCDDADKASTLVTAAAMEKTADGASITITGVTVDGDRGGASTYELSDGASDALRRLMKQSFAERSGDSWHWQGGEWLLAGPCVD